MDNIRFALLCALGVLVFFCYQAWQADYPAEPSAKAQHAALTEHSGGHQDVPSAQISSGETKDQPTQKKAGQSIEVHTDKLDVIISARGGDIRSAKLVDVQTSAEDDSPVQLLSDNPSRFFVLQSGLSGDDAPNHNTEYQTKENSYRLAKDQDTLKVPLTWHDGQGHKVTKVYTFHRGSYEIELDHKVTNNSKQDWKLSQYARFWRTPVTSLSSIPFSRPFLGTGWYQADPDKEGKYSYKKQRYSKLDKDPLKLTQQGGWVAMVQHYFVGAAIPPDHVDVRYFSEPRPTQADPQAFDAGFISAGHVIDPGQSYNFTSQLYIGPKTHKSLAKAANGLDLTVDYGWLTIIAKPIFWVLEKIHALVGNWGIAIIILTLLIKLCFYKLSEKQYRAMARMRKFAPRMKQLKEKYGDDRQALQAKTMELYRKEGFNPLAGCWPMLVQMPVFISLYWVLRGSVELRMASFLWLNDLTLPDPYYILPIIFGVAMLGQQLLQSNVTMDPIQQKMMRIMPIGMAVFFAFFPSGLVLYYSFNSVLSIAQQWYIYRKLDAEGIGHKATTAE